MTDKTELREIGQKVENEVNKVSFFEDSVDDEVYKENRIEFSTGFNEDDVMVDFSVYVENWGLKVEWRFETPQGNSQLDNKGGFYEANDPDDLVSIIQSIVYDWEDGKRY